MQRKIIALLAATVATSIYGINHTVAKSVMPIYIGSLGFVLLRVLGATILFDFKAPLPSLAHDWAEGSVPQRPNP